MPRIKSNPVKRKEHRFHNVDRINFGIFDDDDEDAIEFDDSSKKRVKSDESSRDYKIARIEEQIPNTDQIDLVEMKLIRVGTAESLSKPSSHLTLISCKIIKTIMIKTNDFVYSCTNKENMAIYVKDNSLILIQHSTSDIAMGKFVGTIIDKKNLVLLKELRSSLNILEIHLKFTVSGDDSNIIHPLLLFYFNTLERTCPLTALSNPNELDYWSCRVPLELLKWILHENSYIYVNEKDAIQSNRSEDWFSSLQFFQELERKYTHHCDIGEKSSNDTDFTKLSMDLKNLGMQTTLRPYQIHGIHWMYHQLQSEYCPFCKNGTDTMQRSSLNIWIALQFHPISIKLFDNHHDTPSYLQLGNHQSIEYCCMLNEFRIPMKPSASSTFLIPSQRTHGIVLADEMGLGKTVQLIALSLLLKNTWSGIQIGQDNPSILMNQSSHSPTISKKKRIESMEKRPCLCGNLKSVSKKKGFWVECHRCHRWLHGTCAGFQSQLDVDATDFECLSCQCYQSFHDPDRVRSQGTLVVMPETLINQWKNEIYKHFPFRCNPIHSSSSRSGSHSVNHLPLKIMEYVHCNEEAIAKSSCTVFTPSHLAQFDFILMSYKTLRHGFHQFNASDTSKEMRYAIYPPPITCVQFNLLIVDETQRLESAGVQGSESQILTMSTRLNANYRISASGTPSGHNKLSDLKSLAQFLQIFPYQSTANELHPSVSNDNTGHQMWNNLFMNSFPLMQLVPYPHAVAHRNYCLHKIFDHLILRRMKKDLKNQLELKDHVVIVKMIQFSPFEMALYQEKLQVIIKYLQNQWPMTGGSSPWTNQKNGKDLNLAKGMLETLRKSCCHPQVADQSYRIRHYSRHGHGDTLSQRGPQLMRTRPIKEIMILKVEQMKVSCEEKQRLLIMYLSKLAGLFQLKAFPDNEKARESDRNDSKSQLGENEIDHRLIYLIRSFLLYNYTLKLFQKNRAPKSLIALMKITGSMLSINASTDETLHAHVHQISLKWQINQSCDNHTSIPHSQFNNLSHSDNFGYLTPTRSMNSNLETCVETKNKSFGAYDLKEHIPYKMNFELNGVDSTSASSGSYEAMESWSTNVSRSVNNNLHGWSEYSTMGSKSINIPSDIQLNDLSNKEKMDLNMRSNQRVDVADGFIANITFPSNRRLNKVVIFNGQNEQSNEKDYLAYVLSDMKTHLQSLFKEKSGLDLLEGSNSLVYTVQLFPKDVILQSSIGFHNGENVYSDVFHTVACFPTAGKNMDENSLFSNEIVSTRSKGWRLQVKSVYTMCVVMIHRKPDSGDQDPSSDQFFYKWMDYHKIKSDLERLALRRAIQDHDSSSCRMELNAQLFEASYDVDYLQELHVCHNMLNAWQDIQKRSETYIARMDSDQLDATERKKNQQNVARQVLLNELINDETLRVNELLTPATSEKILFTFKTQLISTQRFDKIGAVDTLATMSCKPHHETSLKKSTSDVMVNPLNIIQNRKIQIENEHVETAKALKLNAKSGWHDIKLQLHDIDIKIQQLLMEGGMDRLWWSDALYWLNHNGGDQFWLSLQLSIEQNGQAYSRLRYFRDISGFLYIINIEYSDIEEKRGVVLKEMEGIIDVPTQYDINESSNCQKCRSYFHKRGSICSHCKKYNAIETYSESLIRYKKLTKHMVNGSNSSKKSKQPNKKMNQFEVYTMEANALETNYPEASVEDGDEYQLKQFQEGVAVDGIFHMFIKLFYQEILKLKQNSDPMQWNIYKELNKLEMQRMDLLKLEMRSIIRYWDRHSELLKSYDELEQCKSRLHCIKDSSQDEYLTNNGTLGEDAIFQYEIDPTIQQTLSLIIAADQEVKEVNGKLNFYKNQVECIHIEDGNFVSETIEKKTMIHPSNECIICRDELKKVQEMGSSSSRSSRYPEEGEENVMLPCGHQYHKYCINRWIKLHRKCPICKETAKSSDLIGVGVNHVPQVHKNSQSAIHLVSKSLMDSSRNVFISNQNHLRMNRYVKGGWGAKVDVLVNDLIRLIRFGKVLDEQDDLMTDRRLMCQLDQEQEQVADDKVIVFSQWIDMLQVVQFALNINGIDSVLCINRSKDFTANGAIGRFKSNSSLRVLLLPLSYGAEGLDLIVASHIFLLEPLLNSQQEMQAINRIHRIGQTKLCIVHKFVIIDTIEVKILQDGEGNKPEKMLMNGKKTNKKQVTDNENVEVSDIIKWLDMDPVR